MPAPAESTSVAIAWRRSGPGHTVGAPLTGPKPEPAAQALFIDNREAHNLGSNIL
jgi:hypothetical protein